MRTRFLAAILISLTLALLAGCGSSSTPSSTATTPPNTGSNTPAPGSNTPSNPPASAADNFFATFTDFVGRNSFPMVFGNITVDAAANDGRGSAHITTHAANSAMYNLMFLSAGNPIVVANFQTDANGNADFTFTFPVKGNFSGIFEVQQNGVQEFDAGINTTVAGVSFNAALLPAGSAPGSGRITATGSSAHVTLTGGLPSHTFDVAVCGTQPTGACSPLGTLISDAHGNAAADIQLSSPIEVGVFVLRDSGGGARQYQSTFRAQ